MFLTFILCIFGTYLTRSGVIDSVHAFGGSLLGTFFLVFLVLLGIASVGLFAWRYRMLAPEHELEGLVSREGAFLLGNVLLLIMMLTTLTGTIFPILSGPFASDPITVKPPFYNKVVAPMGILLVGLMTLGPVLAFGKAAAGTAPCRPVAAARARASPRPRSASSTGTTAATAGSSRTWA
jgi:cytochrome c-type biogenesis protein CcmF